MPNCTRPDTWHCFWKPFSLRYNAFLSYNRSEDVLNCALHYRITVLWNCTLVLIFVNIKYNWNWIRNTEDFSAKLCFVRQPVRVRPRAFSLSFVARSSFFSCLLSLVLSCSVWHAACVFHWAACFYVCHFFCVNTRLISLLISCMFVACFAHG